MFNVIIDGNQYTIAAAKNYLIIQNDSAPAGDPCKKIIKVKEEPGTTYKLQKTQIKATGGAAGLYLFLEECYKSHFMECLADKVLKHAIYTMK